MFWLVREHLLRSQRVLLGSQQLIVHLTADPSVRGGIGLLRLGKRLCLPVGKLLRLRDPHAQNDGGHLLDTLVLDAILPNHFLKIHKGLRLEIMVLLKPSHIVRDSGSDLDDLIAGENLPQRLRNASHQLDPEQESPVLAG